MHTPTAQSAADAMAHECARLRTAAWEMGYEAFGLTIRHKHGQPFISFHICERGHLDDDVSEWVRVAGASWSDAFQSAHDALPGAIAKIKAQEVA